MQDELPKRKNMRLKEYDYSQTGAYFVTVCTHARSELLGKIVGDAAFGVPHIELTPIGEIVRQHIENINNGNGLSAEKYITMPNHIHLLVRIEPGTGTPKAASPTRAIIPQMVNALKGLTTKKYGQPLWQRPYHDHIIRDEAEYLKIWQYIDENPAQWAEDMYFEKH